MRKLAKVLEDVSYKNPNLTISFFENDVAYFLRGQLHTICSHTNEPSTVTRTRAIEPKVLIDEYTDNELMHLIFAFIKELEIHEVYENFYYKGERIFDPHD